MPCQPSTVAFSLPAWLTDYAGERRTIPDIADRMKFVLGAVARNTANGTGGPFAAAVFESQTGALVALGVNLVTTEGLSMLHGEMVAISLAQRRLGVLDLGSADPARYELVTSAEPCAMCYGALPWSGVGRLVVGAREQDVRRIGFDEGDKIAGWKKALEKRGIEVLTDVVRGEAVAVLEDYVARGGVIYNAGRPS